MSRLGDWYQRVFHGRVYISTTMATCVECGAYAMCGLFDEVPVCGLCVKGIIGRHPSDPL